MTTSSEMVVISGASTGMGAATAKELARRGLHVLAGVRREGDADALRADGIEPVILDIIDAGHLAALVERVGDSPVHALINNAGVAVNAPVETLSLDDWRRHFEVNLFGHIAMTQALLPALRTGHGRVVNISSVGGRVAMAGYGAYSRAKFALEAVSDALRREISGQGVQVVVIEPGGVKTAMVGSGTSAARDQLDRMDADQRSRYGALMQAVMGQAEAFTASGLPAERAARVIADAVTAKRPRSRYTIGRDAALMTRIARIAPDRLMDRLTAPAQRPYYPR